MVSSDPDQLRLTTREALLSRSLSHPHLVQTYAISLAQLTEQDLRTEAYTDTPQHTRHCADALESGDETGRLGSSQKVNELLATALLSSAPDCEEVHHSTSAGQPGHMATFPTSRLSTSWLSGTLGTLHETTTQGALATTTTASRLHCPTNPATLTGTGTAGMATAAGMSSSGACTATLAPSAEACGSHHHRPSHPSSFVATTAAAAAACASDFVATAELSLATATGTGSTAEHTGLLGLAPAAGPAAEQLVAALTDGKMGAKGPVGSDLEPPGGAKSLGGPAVGPASVSILNALSTPALAAALPASSGAGSGVARLSAHATALGAPQAPAIDHPAPALAPVPRAIPTNPCSPGHTPASLQGLLLQQGFAVPEQPGAVRVGAPPALADLMEAGEFAHLSLASAADEASSARFLEELQALGAAPGRYVTIIVTEFCEGTLLGLIQRRAAAAAVALGSATGMAPAAGVAAALGMGSPGLALPRGRSLLPRINTGLLHTPSGTLSSPQLSGDSPAALARGAAARNNSCGVGPEWLAGPGGSCAGLAPAAAREATHRPGNLELLRNALEISQAMAHLHSLDLVHGDLKPANVLVRSAVDAPGPGAAYLVPTWSHGGDASWGDPSGRRGYVCKVADFGLTNPVESAEGLPRETNGRGWGALAYLAPELVTGGKRGKPADVYSYGALLWHMATGQAPHASLHPAQILVGLASGELALDWPEGADRTLRKIGAACLAHDPANRPSFERIVRALLKAIKRTTLRLQQQQQQHTLVHSSASTGVSAHRDTPSYGFPHRSGSVGVGRSRLDSSGSLGGPPPGASGGVGQRVGPPRTSHPQAQRPLLRPALASASPAHVSPAAPPATPAPPPHHLSGPATYCVPPEGFLLSGRTSSVATDAADARYPLHAAARPQHTSLPQPQAQAQAHPQQRATSSRDVGCVSSVGRTGPGGEVGGSDVRSAVRSAAPAGAAQLCPACSLRSAPGPGAIERNVPAPAPRTEEAEVGTGLDRCGEPPAGGGAFSALARAHAGAQSGILADGLVYTGFLGGL